MYYWIYLFFVPCFTKKDSKLRQMSGCRLIENAAKLVVLMLSENTTDETIQKKTLRVASKSRRNNTKKSGRNEAKHRRHYKFKRTMNPIMMIPHNFKYKKSHPDDNPTTTTTKIHRSICQEDPKQLYCHSPSENPKSAWAKNVNAFVKSGHVEDYDGLCWCDWTNGHFWFTLTSLHQVINAFV